MVEVPVAVPLELRESSSDRVNDELEDFDADCSSEDESEKLPLSLDDRETEPSSEFDCVGVSDFEEDSSSEALSV